MILALLRFGFFYTRVDPQLAIWAAERAQWSVVDPALASVIEWFANPFTKREGILAMAAHLLPEVSRRGSPQFRTDVIISELLSHIAKRPDGLDVIARLWNRLDVVCGVDFATAENLKHVLHVWRAAHESL